MHYQIIVYVSDIKKKKILEAINLIENGMSIREASRQKQINYSLLQRKFAVHGKNNDITVTDTRRYLSSEQEICLKNHIINCALRGFPRTNHDILNDAYNIAIAFNDSKAKKPGRVWLKGFMRRNPELSSRKSEFVNKAHSQVCIPNLKKWHTHVEGFLKEKGLAHLLKDPSVICNCDETGITLAETNLKHIGPKKVKARYAVQNGNAKENVSVMFTAIADGIVLKPFIIFKGQRLSQKLVSTIPENVDYTINASGWMDQDVFLDYLKNSFVPQMIALQRKAPYILFLDGHKSHISIEISETCEALGIILISLYPNTTHITQPLDVSFFRPLKSKWQAELRQRKNNDVNFLRYRKQTYLLYYQKYC